MTRDEAKRKAWFDSQPFPDCMAMISPQWDQGFDAGWSARECPDFQSVIDWLEHGCDPIKAAEELRIHQANIRK